MKKWKCVVVIAILLLTIGGILLLHSKVKGRKNGRNEEIAVDISYVEVDSSYVTNPEGNLWDGSMKDSFWSSKGSEQSDETVTAKICLEQAYDVCRVELYPCIIEGETCYFPQDFTISVSTNGEEWTKVYEIVGYKMKGTEKQEISFEVQTEIQYIRLQMMPVKEARGSDLFYVRLGEVVIFAEN